MFSFIIFNAGVQFKTGLLFADRNSGSVNQNGAKANDNDFKGCILFQGAKLFLVGKEISVTWWKREC